MIRPNQAFAAAAIVVLTAACAQDIAGVSPFDPRGGRATQLHFPLGMVLVPGQTPAMDRLIVANTNFDQRFSAGSLMSLSVDALFAALDTEGLGRCGPRAPESF